MTRKADFNAEEWTTLVNGPVYAGMRVISADRGGTLRETLAMGRVFQDARLHHGESELLDELVNSPPSIDTQQFLGTGDVSALVTAQLQQATQILEAKASPADLDAYKRFVMTVAQTVASAHKEGGLLGIGGKDVSEAEDEALDEISSALGSPPTS